MRSAIALKGIGLEVGMAAGLSARRGATLCIVLLLLVVGSSSPRLSQAAESALFMRGDANLDGGVSISDVFAVLRHLHLGQPVRCRDAADANDDGALNLVDPIFLVSAVFRLGNAIPPPFHAAGFDPTEDALDCETSLQPSRRVKAVVEENVPCRPEDDGGGIADLEFVSFLRPVKVIPGQAHALAPVFLSTAGNVEGFTLAFHAPPERITLQSFHVEGRLYDEAKHPAGAEVLDGMTSEGYIAVNVVMASSPPFNVVPATRNASFGLLEFSISESARVGDEYLVRFVDIPGSDGFQPVRNDLSRLGSSIQFGVCPLVVQVVSEDELFIRGDANRDWRVNLTDALTILRGLFGSGSPLAEIAFPCADSADVSDDGEVDVGDAVRLLSHLFDGGPPPESPYPQPGHDSVVPEASPLTCGGF